MKIIETSGSFIDNLFQLSLSNYLFLKGFDVFISDGKIGSNINSKCEYLHILNKYKIPIGKFSRDTSNFFLYEEKSLNLERILKDSRDSIVRGSWRNFSLFEDLEEDLKKCFNADLQYLNNYTIDLLKKIGDCHSPIICVSLDENLDNSYYYYALSYIYSYILQDFEVLFFCKKTKRFLERELNLNFNYHIIDYSQCPEYDRLYLMSKCKYHILNSDPLSYWGAWLSNSNINICLKSEYDKYFVSKTDKWKFISPSNICKINELDKNLFKISVLFPIYNGDQYLKEALDSVLSQSFKNLEIITINDGSTDNTSEIINDYISKDNRVKKIEHTVNKGLAAARNTGFLNCDKASRYILSHDCDDISLSNKFENLLDYLLENHDADVVGSFAEYFDKDPNIILGNPNIAYDSKIIHDTFHITNHMVVSSCLCKRRVYEKCYPFNEEFNVAEDYDFWSKALMKGFKLSNIPKVLHKIRVHSDSLGSANPKDMKRICNIIQSKYSKYLESLKVRDVPSIICKRMKRGKKIGLIIIAIGDEYYSYALKMIKSARTYFLKNHDVKYFILTDKKDAKTTSSNLNIICINCIKSWPAPTLLRYEMIYNASRFFSNLDYLYYIDADMKFTDYVGNEILGDLVGTTHPGYFSLDPSCFPYESNPLSTSFIPKHKKISPYFAGGFNGGKRQNFLNMCITIKDWIRRDIKSNIIAVWDDESYLNKYLIDNIPDVILGPEYCYASDPTIHSNVLDYPLDGKIEVVDKFTDHSINFSDRELQVNKGKNIEEIANFLGINILKKEEKILSIKSLSFTPEIIDVSSRIKECSNILSDCSVVLFSELYSLDKYQNLEFSIYFLQNIFSNIILISKDNNKSLSNIINKFGIHNFRINGLNLEQIKTCLLKFEYIFFQSFDLVLDFLYYKQARKKILPKNIVQPYEKVVNIPRKYLSRLYKTLDVHTIPVFDMKEIEDKQRILLMEKKLFLNNLNNLVKHKIPDCNIIKLPNIALHINHFLKKEKHDNS